MSYGGEGKVGQAQALPHVCKAKHSLEKKKMEFELERAIICFYLGG